MFHPVPVHSPRARLRALALAAAAPVLLGLVATGPVAQAQPERRAARESGTASFRVASFNMLGSNHTEHSSRWRSGHERAKLARRWLQTEGISVVGLQEGQVDQLRTLTRSKRWDSYPDPRTSTNSETAQSVAWRRGSWRLMEAHVFRIPFDGGQLREQPVVRLRNRHTGQRIWVISVHMTAGRGEVGERERRIGTRRLLNQVKELRGKHQRVVVTGDMNSHDDFYCQVAGTTDLRAANGGSYNTSRGCRPPAVMHVDWLFASPSVEWTGLQFADGGVLDEITDHTVPVAGVRLH